MLDFLDSPHIDTVVICLMAFGFSIFAFIAVVCHFGEKEEKKRRRQLYWDTYGEMGSLD